MWINFDSSGPFLVKIYAGDVNVISGEPGVECHDTIERRLALHSEGKSLQDYIVTPEQDWLDGIATAAGVVKQFVAVNMGSGSSIEAQIMGQDITGGLQIEVTPAFAQDLIQISLIALTGWTSAVWIRPDETILNLKKVIRDVIGWPVEHIRLIFARTLLENGKIRCPLQETLLLTDLTGQAARWRTMVLRRYETQTGPVASAITSVTPFQFPCSLADKIQGSILHLTSNLRGGGGGPVAPVVNKPLKQEMTLGAGGMIKQDIVHDKYPRSTWNSAGTITFNVQILTPQTYSAVTGKPAPECPIDAQTYAKSGAPFYALSKPPAPINGVLKGIKTVGEINKWTEPAVDVPVVTLGEESKSKTVRGIQNPRGTLLAFRTVSDLKEQFEESSEE